MSYPSLTFQALVAAASGSETITLNSTAPPGLAIKFFKNSVTLLTDGKATVQLTINASQSVTPGDYKIKVGAMYGTSSKTYDLPIRVVTYLISESNNNFSPGALTVKSGSTVYWINLDTPSQDPEVHNVVFSSGSSTQSPNMMQYDEYSFTFTAPGTYAYFCAFHPGMKGTVTVTA